MSTDVKIPETGRATDELLAEMRGFRSGDADWRGGRTWSLVYYAGDAHHALLKEAYGLYIAENGLNPMAFRSLKRMESDVVRMTANMLHGDEQTVGTMSSGGTESILLAVKAARDRAQRRHPEIVLPRTAHVAFEKAAHYFGMKLRYAPVDEGFRADVRAMRRLINHNTVLLVASAPQYPHGVVDPVEEIAALARDKHIPMHVDACLGGFILPWIERLGGVVPTWDFRVPGVTSISADAHKFGFASKGASVILYRSMDYLKHQFFVSTDWPGGVYPSPGIAGTRPGGSIAAAWAAMMAMGEDGYLAQARRALDAAQELAAGVRAIPGLTVLGAPDATIVALAADGGPESVDLYAVADQLEERGWNVDRQQYPPSLHHTVTGANAEAVVPYLDDLRAAVAHVRAHPELKASGNAAMYGMIAKVPIRGVVKHSVLKIMEAMYGPEGEVPDLSKPSEGQDDLIMSLVDRYGAEIMRLLERFDGLRSTIARVRRRLHR